MKVEEQRVDLREQLMIGMPGRQFRQQVERQLSLSQARPDAPRGVRIVGTVLKWDAPQDARGVTHYSVYADDDGTPARRIVVGQTECSDPITGRRFYVASFNLFTGAESSKIMLDAGSTVTLGPDTSALAVQPIGDITITDARWEHTEPDVDGVRRVRVYLGISPPSPVGEFNSVLAWAEKPDQSAGTPAVAGSATAGGGQLLVGEWTPQYHGRITYVAGKPIVLLLDGPKSDTEDWRIYLASAGDVLQNKIVRQGSAGATPNVVITVTKWDGPSGEDYAPNVTNFTIISNATFNDDGKLKRRIETGWTYPDDPRVIGATGDMVGADGKVFHSGGFGTSGVTAAGGAVWIWDEPTLPGTEWALRVRTMTRAGSNGYVRGVTPELFVTVGTATGTLDLGQALRTTIAAHLDVTSGVLGVKASGITEELIANLAVTTTKLVDEAVGSNKIAPFAVTAAKIGNAAIQNAHFDRATANKIAIISADIVSLAAAKITAGTLAVGVVYAGTINANQVNAGTFNGMSLILDSNGITTKVDNSLVNSGYAGLQVYLTSGSTFTSLVKVDRMEIVKPSGTTLAARMSAWDAGAGTSYGEVSVWNTASSEAIRLDGLNSQITIGGNAVVRGRQTIGGGGDTLANLYIALRAHGLIA